MHINALQFLTYTILFQSESIPAATLCKSDECPWYLFATPVAKGTTIWRIKKSIQMHTCHSINHLGHKNLDEDFISTEILPKLHNDTSYTPKVIQIDIKFGIEIDYQKAYQSKERALKHINGSHEGVQISTKILRRNQAFQPWNHSCIGD